MKRVILLVLLPVAALAETLTWDPVTKTEDGQPATIKEYRLYEQRVLKKVIPAPTVVAAVTIKPATQYAWEVTAVDTKGVQSRYSNVLIITPPPVPTLQWPPSGPNNLRPGQ